MLSQTTINVLIGIQAVGVTSTIIVLGLAIVAYRRANAQLQYAREKAKRAREQMKNFLDSFSAALDD